MPAPSLAHLVDPSRTAVVTQECQGGTDLNSVLRNMGVTTIETWTTGGAS